LAPVGMICPRREVPFAGEPQSAFDRDPAALLVSDTGSDAGVRILTPDFFLRRSRPPREAAMVPCEVYRDPRGRDISPREHFRYVVMRDERKLHTAPHLRLHVAQESRFVQRVHDSGRETAQPLAFGGLLAQERNERFRSPQRFLITHAREI